MRATRKPRGARVASLRQLPLVVSQATHSHAHSMHPISVLTPLSPFGSLSRNLSLHHVLLHQVTCNQLQQLEETRRRQISHGEGELCFPFELGACVPVYGLSSNELARLLFTLLTKSADTRVAVCAPVCMSVRIWGRWRAIVGVLVRFVARRSTGPTSHWKPGRT